MTYEQQTTILTWFFCSLAALGAYGIVVAPFLYIWHLLHKTQQPTPTEPKLERWRWPSYQPPARLRQRSQRSSRPETK
jgi:hypothetical protein